MSDNPNFPPEMYDDMGEDSPFFGLDGWDGSSKPDPYEGLEREVLETMGIESFDAILISSDESVLENARGNRFETIQEAIFYLFDSGILLFSGVEYENEDYYGVEIDGDSGSVNVA